MDWKPVIDPMLGGYLPGFDPAALLQFRRGSDGDVRSYRMADQHPAFNVWGLEWRDPLSSLCAKSGEKASIP